MLSGNVIADNKALAVVIACCISEGTGGVGKIGRSDKNLTENMAIATWTSKTGALMLGDNEIKIKSTDAVQSLGSASVLINRAGCSEQNFYEQSRHGWKWRTARKKVVQYSALFNGNTRSNSEIMT